jgi:rhodanese-related sulfurtransferase
MGTVLCEGVFYAHSQSGGRNLRYFVPSVKVSALVQHAEVAQQTIPGRLPVVIAVTWSDRKNGAVINQAIAGPRMTRKTLNDLVAERIPLIDELLPWELLEEQARDPNLLLVDIRCQDEVRLLRIKQSIAVPRGILESACDYGYDETLPRLVEARHQRVVAVCRSGNRSVLAAHTLRIMGFSRAASLKSGLKGWNDYELPLFDANDCQVDPDLAERLLNPPISPEKLGPGIR